VIFFNEKYNFWPVYESIKKYYPIGCIEDWELLYKYRAFDYPGKMELESIILDNVHTDNNFNSRWVSIEHEIETLTKKKVIGTTYGQVPCFSGYLELETISTENFTRAKELYFFVSFVGPFYSIIGQDRSIITFDKRKIYHTNYLVVSPENEFAELFGLVEKKIKEKFPGYGFTPFHLCTQELEGLSVRRSNDEHNKTVFHALFNDQIDIAAEFIGDGMYGSNKWIREDYDLSNEGGWNVYPPTE
jgi:hypothetical protein